MSDPLNEAITGTLKLAAEGPLLACHYPAGGDIIIISLLRSVPANALPDHEAPQRAFTYLKYGLNKDDSDPLTITQGFWPISGSTSELCIVEAK
jgi:hypothetical protein